MEQVRSADGTSIAFLRAGEGPPLLLVHGALCDHHVWYALLPFLTPHFTVYALDRRGRGASANTLPYTVDREVEDLLAVLERIDEPVNLFGHSSGAILALKTALQSVRVQRLMLYEPPLFGAGQQRQCL